jgi:hypothetical protein
MTTKIAIANRARFCQGIYLKLPVASGQFPV